MAGLDEAGSLAIYGPLIEGTLGNARSLGIRAALTGPMTRGDVGTLRAHLDALARHAPGVLPLYVAAAQREIDLATRPWRPRTGVRDRDARRPGRSACAATLTRYHCGPWDTPSPPSTRPGRRRDSFARPAVPASAGWDSGRVVTFSPATGRMTELQRSGGLAVSRLHGGWRNPRPVRPSATSGRPRPAVRMRWTRSDGRGPERTARADTAPWPG